MSSDYFMLQGSNPAKGSAPPDPRKSIKSTSINDSGVNQEELSLYKLFREPTTQEDDEHDIDDQKDLAQQKQKAQIETTDFTDQDQLIKDYFLNEEFKSPIVYLDVKTTFYTSFKISDEEIICFDEKEKILKKISMLEKYEDEEKKTFARKILKSISQQELFKEAVKTSLDEDQVEDRSISEEELEFEKVSRVEPSADKKQIFVGTTFGRIAVISPETFEVYGILRNTFESPVKDIAVKKTTLIVGYENGQIDLYEKKEDQQLYKRSSIKTPVPSRSQISCNSPQYKCTKNHTLVFHDKDPYGNNGARCDECKTSSCISMGYLFHCPECGYDLCKNCTSDYDKYGKKTEITGKCTKGHTLELRTKDPYGNSGARCNECKTSSCISMGYIFHCPECKYDLCAGCDRARHGKRLKPTCNKRHEMQLLKEKPSYYSSNLFCDFCGEKDLVKDKSFYHCKDCKFDKCYYCNTKQDIMALKASQLTDHLAVVQRPLNENTDRKDLIIYNLKDRLKVGEKNSIICQPPNNYFLKKLIYFTKNNLIVRSDNKFSYKVLSLKDGSDQKSTPETIDSQTIQKIDIWKDDKTIILIGNTGNIYIYDEKGKQASLPNVQLYFISGINEMSFTSLQGKVTFLKLPQKVYDQQQVFTELQNSLYFADQENSFFIELRGNPKPSFPEDLKDALITPDEKIFAYDITIDGITTVVIYDQIKNEELRVLPGYDLVSCSQNSKYLYCQTADREPQNLALVGLKQNSGITKAKKTTDKSQKMFVQVNLETFKIHTIFEMDEQNVIQVNKDDTLAYIRKYDKGTGEYNLHVVDIKEGNKLFEYKTELKDEFLYRLSNDETYIILTTKEKKLQKITIINEGRQLKSGLVIDHAPGISGQISFNKDSKKFICGGNDTSDLIMYDADTLKVLYTVEQHKGTGNYCFFAKANRLVTKETGEMICWDIEKIQEPLKLFQAKVGLNIYSYNRKLIGFMINNEPRVWNERLMHELSNNIKLLLPTQYEKVINEKKEKLEELKLSKSKSAFFTDQEETQESTEIKCTPIKKKEWTLGPLNKLLPQILQQFWDSDYDEQTKRMPLLNQFVIMPYGYTFLEKLVFDNKIDLIQQAIQDSNMKYITDIYGNNPLTYALKRKNFEVLNILLEFFIQNPAYIKNLRFIEFIALLKLGPSQIPELLNKFVEPIMQKQNLGSKIDDVSETYFLQDPLKKFKEEDVMKKLLEQNAEEKDKYPIVFHATMMNLRFTCKESTQFYLALDECPCEEIFSTPLIQKITDYKWSKTKIVANLFLAFQIGFLVCVTYSSFQPGYQLMLYVMMGFAFIFGIVEFIICVESQYSMVYVDKFKLTIIILVFTYCLSTLHEMTESADSLLPFINLFAWFNLVIEMQQFERTRQFVCVVLSSVQSITGFLIFLFLMIASFASTTNLFIKNRERHIAFQDAPQPWYFERQFFKKYKATRTLSKDFSALWQQLFETWITIVKGDYDDSLASTFSYQIFLLFLTFVANITLLNLIVAIMSDAYGEVMTSIVVKKTKSLNAMMLRYDKILFRREQVSNQRQLIWVTYNDESANGWVSQTDAINSQVKKSSREILDQFTYTESVIVTQQKEQANATATLSGRVSTLQTNVDDQTKQIREIRASQDQQMKNIDALIIYKNKKEKKAEENKQTEDQGKVKGQAQEQNKVEAQGQNDVLKKLAELQKSSREILDQFTNTEQVIVGQQKEQANATATLSGVVSTLQTNADDQTKQIREIRESQDLQMKNIDALIIYKNKKEKKAEENKKAENEDKDKVEAQGQNDVLKKLAELEKNQKEFQTQILQLFQQMKTQTNQQIPVGVPVETNPSQILDDQKMIQLRNEITKRFHDHNKLKVILQLTNGELGQNINHFRQEFLHTAKDNARSVVIIKSDQGQEFGFFVPDVWENTEGKPDLQRDFYSPYKNCKEVLNEKPFAFLFNDGKIQIFEWIHHQTPLIWSRDDEFLSICMGIAIRGDRQGDYAYLDPLCWQLPHSEFKKCKMFRSNSLAFCNDGTANFKAESIEVFGTNS